MRGVPKDDHWKLLSTRRVGAAVNARFAWSELRADLLFLPRHDLPLVQVALRSTRPGRGMSAVELRVPWKALAERARLEVLG